MKIRISCGNCHKELRVKSVEKTPLDEVEFVVESCSCIDCYDCSGCEDIDILQSNIRDLDTKIVQLQNEIKELEKEKIDE